MGINRPSLKHTYTLLMLSALLFIPFAGDCPLFDWDEVNFAECAREMVVSGNYAYAQINFKPFWEKPPFFMWMQAMAMHVFGINEFAARFPNALCGMLSLWFMYVVGTKTHNRRFGYMWAIIYTATLLPHFYFRSGIIDPWFNLFIFYATWQAYLLIHSSFKENWWRALLGGVALGLAVLTKGPAALLIAGTTVLVYIVMQREFKVLLQPNLWLFALSALVSALSWFMVQWMTGNEQIIKTFVDYQVRLFETGDAGHSGPFFYHALVILLGCFPASLIFLTNLHRNPQHTPAQNNLQRFMKILFLVVLVIFSVVKTKIVHYSSLTYFPLTFIVTDAIVNANGLPTFSKWLKPLYWLIGSVITLALTLVTSIYLFKDRLLTSGLINDEFALGNLQAEANWTGFERIIPVLFLAGTILFYKATFSAQKNPRLLLPALGVFIVFIWSTVVLLLPRIEEYTQHAAIDFYKEKGKESCYIETQGFKSYAFLFYSNRLPSDYDNPEQIKYIERQLDEMVKEGHSRITSYGLCNLFWMVHGTTDRVAYVVTKPSEKKEMEKFPWMVKLYEKNGYVFYKRDPGPATPY